MPTLRTAWTEYQLTRPLKAKTLKNYNGRLTLCFSDWLDLELTSITRDMISARHKEIRGEAMANSAMRTLKAIFNFASAKYEDEIEVSNPVFRLNATRSWYRDKRRIGVLHTAQLKPWWHAIRGLDNKSLQDFFFVVLMTGMRRSEARDLIWDRVDFSLNSILLVDTKTESRSFPVSSHVAHVLEERRHYAESPFVFDDYCGSQQLSDAKIDSAKAEVCRRTELKWCVHDLRRTFITTGDYLNEKVETVQALVGHKPTGMTNSYTIRSLERLRRTAQSIDDALYEAMECGRFVSYEAGTADAEIINDGVLCHADFDNGVRKLSSSQTTAFERQPRIHQRHFAAKSLASPRD